jgi:protein SCO1/2
MTVLKRLFLFSILIFAGSAFAAPPVEDTAAKSYPASGVVEKIAPDRHTATIHNQDIPGYMMEMTMDFPVQNTNELNGVSPGDKIMFTVMVAQNDSWIQGVQRTGERALVETDAMQTMPAAMRELGAGDALPDGLLVAEDGRRIHFSDFRGRALAFTFFFTRCPMPNYCPLMNKNFSAARDVISSTANAPTNWEFLSISFDPENDTPQVLATFGGFYRGENPDHWLFASMATNTLATLGPALDLMVVHQGSSISHNLRTVVLDTQGRIYRQFDGNQWTPQELAEAMISAARE